MPGREAVTVRWVGTIYLRHGDQFLAIHERPSDAEALLQALLADHPEVLAGESRMVTVAAGCS